MYVPTSAPPRYNVETPRWGVSAVPATTRIFAIRPPLHPPPPANVCTGIPPAAIQCRDAPVGRLRGAGGNLRR